MIMKIGIVSGEASGDILGAGLISELKKYYPDATYEGVGGKKMISEGFSSLFPQDRLAVMGLIEPLKRLPELLSIRKQLYQHFINNKFDLMIGIDSPDFNLSLEGKLKKQGVKTVHYVSPSVWAWRQGRIKKIAKSIDLMLTLLPFETAIYHQYRVPVKFVGHPLADQFPIEHDQAQAKKTLSLLLKNKRYNPNLPLLACLPGSRNGEVKLIGPVFWQALEQCCDKIHKLQVIVPAAGEQRCEQIEAQLKARPNLSVTLVEGHSHEVMAAADAVLLASGTTALEAMLLKKPMVVVYKMAALSYWIISSLLKIPYVSLPNLLANRLLVPELLQQQATADSISQHVIEKIQEVDHRENIVKEFTKLHQDLKGNADYAAAKAIKELLEA
ncbi:MAG: lipid-A-disaccharide synthase [Cellvibrionaceae bacterium]|jgi:lipid-A-disaccharide synthase